MRRGEFLRILDANFNRSREGLRVCEELARFILEDKILTRRLKDLRHEVTECLKTLKVSPMELLTHRDVKKDVGKKTSKKERIRKDFSEIFFSNIERVKESLRVLEEITKLLGDQNSDRFKKARFEAYAIEKRIIPKWVALSSDGRKDLSKSAHRGRRKKSS